MRQEIHEDEHGYDAWDRSLSSRCFVHILNSAQWEGATGKTLPGAAPTASDYTEAGLPWFEYYDDQLGALEGAKKLASLDSVATKGGKLGAKPLPEDDAVQPARPRSPSNSLTAWASNWCDSTCPSTWSVMPSPG